MKVGGGNDDCALQCVCCGHTLLQFHNVYRLLLLLLQSPAED